ncbi:hypothetical protein MYMAC_004504 [Corallococcus macrosporus DSM 14697]|uniref:Uncharacterized protein n=1 Tax=Corallococcus macrosporus DSM 14697 TaxID=1189310 RepID=A0A250JYR6_9BACT|nr:hypothetical protein MYMAC_004504 [Corallococcus macrosporus DSM 14697]
MPWVYWSMESADISPGWKAAKSTAVQSRTPMRRARSREEVSASVVDHLK